MEQITAELQERADEWVEHFDAVVGNANKAWWPGDETFEELTCPVCEMGFEVSEDRFVGPRGECHVCFLEASR